MKVTYEYERQPLEKYKRQPLSYERVHDILLNFKPSERVTRSLKQIYAYVWSRHYNFKHLRESKTNSHADHVISVLSEMESSYGRACKIDDHTYEFPKYYKPPGVYTEIYGSGNQWVYLYYFNNDTGDAECVFSKSYSYERFYCGTWRCKIGRAQQNPEKRVKDQTSGCPESPIIGLLFRTDDCATLEKLIHGHLKLLGRHIKAAQGDEWFETNPSEVASLWCQIMDIYLEA